jgi:hypothetical protein
LEVGPWIAFEFLKDESFLSRATGCWEWDFSGMEIPESESVSSYKICSYETVKIIGAELGSRFSSGSPITYEFTVDSSKVVITNIKSSSDDSINIPTGYTSGITNYTTNYVSDLNTIQLSHPNRLGCLSRSLNRLMTAGAGLALPLSYREKSLGPPPVIRAASRSLTAPSSQALMQGT